MIRESYKIIPILAIVPGMLMAAQPIHQIESEVPVSHVYAPAGFNSNDEAGVVVSGYLPNLCYRGQKSQVNVVGNKIQIGVKAMKSVGRLQYCADVILPFVEHIKIGLLDQGNYQVAVNENSQFEKNAKLQVAEASSNSNGEEIFANVNQIVNVENSRKVILKGYNPSDCFELDKIEVIDNGVDSYSIMPKLRQVRDFCPKKEVEFNYEFSVPEKLQADQVLLHVKVMDGKFIDSLYNNNSPAEE